MHPRHPGVHIAIDRYLLILSFELKFFVCRHVSLWGFQNPVCLSVPREKKIINHPSFVNISSTLIIGTCWRGFHEYYSMETIFFFFFFIKCLYYCFFCRVLSTIFSLCCAHLWVCFLMQLINIQVGFTYICVNYMHICVSTSLHHWTFIL